MLVPWRSLATVAAATSCTLLTVPGAHAASAPEFRLKYLSVSVSGTSVVAKARVAASPAATVDADICVRDASGAAVDLPAKTDLVLTPHGRTYQLPARALDAGTYTYWACITYQGQQSRVGAPETFTVGGAQQPPSSSPVTKVLTFVEENHSREQMANGMPYTWGLAQQYAYATDYRGIRHPSLPNYLAMAGGSTFGVSDDAGPDAHPIAGASVFGQALAAGHTAATYTEGMTTGCQTDNSGPYAVKHNPWAYFTDERAACLANDGSVGDPDTGRLAADAASGDLPDVGLVVPNLDHDAHDGSLAGADRWLQAHLPAVLASDDFTSGRLAVVVTADEDDRGSGNVVLTVVLHASLDGAHRVVSTPLNHYSLTKLYAQVVGATPLGSGVGAPDLAAAFGLTVREGS